MFKLLATVGMSLSTNPEHNLSAVRNPLTPVWCLKHMLDRTAADIQFEIIVSGRLPESKVKLLATSPHHHRVKRELVKQLKDSKVLAYILNDSRNIASLRAEVIKNPNLRHEDVMEAVNDGCFAELAEVFPRTNSDSKKKYQETADLYVSLLTHSALDEEVVDRSLAEYLEKFPTSPISSESQWKLADNRKASRASVIAVMLGSSSACRELLIDGESELDDEEEERFVQLCKDFLKEQGTNVEEFPAEYVLKVSQLALYDMFPNLLTSHSGNGWDEVM